MIRIGWPEIMAAAEAAIASDGQTPSEADRRILRAMARGVATVLGSSLHAPGEAPEAAFEEVALVNADGASVTLEPSEAMTTDYALTLPVDAGVAGQALVTDGDGGLSWAAGAGGVQVDDEGVTVVGAATILNFAGAGVTATLGGAGEALVTIPGGISNVPIEEGGALIVNATRINFDGAGVTVADAGGGEALVTISGGGGGGGGNGYFPQGWV